MFQLVYLGCEGTGRERRLVQYSTACSTAPVGTHHIHCHYDHRGKTKTNCGVVVPVDMLRHQLTLIIRQRQGQMNGTFNERLNSLE
jgi:hypothetical protein